MLIISLLEYVRKYFSLDGVCLNLLFMVCNCFDVWNRIVRLCSKEDGRNFNLYILNRGSNRLNLIVFLVFFYRLYW